MAGLSIESAAVRVEVDPGFGARVLSLIDRRSGRDWMAKGPQSANTGEEAVYLADEAVGWDECFPTVARWDAASTVWARNLRDHGDLWGRAWTVDSHTAGALTLSYTDKDFRFTRTLAIHGEVVVASYRVDNLGSVDLPFLWALHGLLAVTPNDRIELPGIDTVAATYVTRDGATLDLPTSFWPGPARDLDLPLDVIHPAATRFAAKLYASDVPGSSVSVGGANGWLDIDWEEAEIAHLGLWLNYGGWPAPGNVHHIALEPTTGPVDDLGTALATGTAVTLAPGDSKSWTVTLALRTATAHHSPTDPTR